jgi:hypothetical protein
MSEKEELQASLISFAVAMKDRLFEKADEGRTRWKDPEAQAYILEHLWSAAAYIALSEDRLSDEGIENIEIEQLKLVDIANWAMFLWRQTRAEQVAEKDPEKSA